MPIRKYVAGSQFDPETIAIMVAAFDAARVILNLDRDDDPLVEVVAKKVISVTSEGLRDPAEIRRRVVVDTLRHGA